MMSPLQSAGAEARKIHIVGQGLAGSVLALELHLKGYDVDIIDNGHLSSSSIIAAGMWNPVSFINLHEIWRAHEMLPAADKVYRKFEKLLGLSFYHPKDLVRIFPDNYAANIWDEKSVHPELSDFLSADQDEFVARHGNQPFGHGIVKQGGWLNMPVFLHGVKDFFMGLNKFIQKEITADDERAYTDSGEIVIFCTGWKGIRNGCFNWMPMIPNKGEVLTVQCDHIKTDNLINFGKFLIALGNGVFRLGATYELGVHDLRISNASADQMIGELKTLFPGEVILLDHKAGFRPTLHDRKPVMGFHPLIPSMGIFNGFGSRGVSLIPYFADHFAQHISSGEPIMKDVGIMRYWKKILHH